MAKPVFSTGDVPSADEVNDWFVNTIFARKLSTESVTSSTVLQDDNDLTVAVESNAVYELSSILKYDGATQASGAGDLKIQWVGPSGASLDWMGAGLGPAGSLFTDDQTLFGDFTTTPSFGTIGAGTSVGLLIQGLLVVSSTAGNLKLTWAQGTSSATATRIFANSYVSLRRRE